MPVTRSRAKALAAPAAAEPSTDSQAGSMSTASQIAKSSSQRSVQRGKTSKDHKVAALPTTEPSPYMLPTELLVDIFLYLNTFDVGRAAQVCRTWHAATSDVRLWRSLRFTTRCTDKPPNFVRLQVREQLKCIGARSGNTVESLELDGLPWPSVAVLTESLKASASSLKHIRWSSMRWTDIASTKMLEDVMKLARACPQLETLELHTVDACNIRQLFDRDVGVAKPGHFSLIMSELLEDYWAPVPPQSPGSLAAPFDHATTIEVRPIRYDADTCIGSVGMRSFARLLENQAIEKLTVHGLWSGSTGTHSLSAPALTSLDLRYSGYMDQSLAQIDAPQLRELAIDGTLLSKLTPASTAILSSLTLRFARLNNIHPDPLETLGLGRVRDHQGSVKLSVDLAYMHEVLELFLHDFFWPGLEHVRVELKGHAVCNLISIIAAARQAGARGASKEQYLAVLHDAAFQPFISSSPSPQAIVDAAQRLMAGTDAIQVTPDARPLCSSVQWLIVADQCVSASVADWLKELPNVTVERLSSP